MDGIIHKSKERVSPDQEAKAVVCGLSFRYPVNTPTLNTSSNTSSIQLTQPVGVCHIPLRGK